jgi:predicted protein tyrosine phosphatase
MEKTMNLPSIESFLCTTIKQCRTMKVLFICNQNQHRSKTAEILFQKKFETKSAGLYNQSPVTEREMQWADVVVVMEDHQRTELGKRFPTLYLQKRIVSLNISDMYARDQPELVTLLKKKVSSAVEPNL